MPSTYTLIKGETIASSAASYTFSAIPSTFTDLVVRTSTRDDRVDTQNAIQLTFNGNSSTVYSLTNLRGNGSSPSTDRSSNQTFARIEYENSTNSTTNTFTSGEFYIPSYLASQNKPSSTFITSERNATEAFIYVYANLFSSTTAISSLTLAPVSANFVSGSSFYLYGVKNA